ncbi:MAG: hypothetical protein IPG74_15070 [Flavobacteriales bacterium]|nr:hypothetical protein [Flavobacteriales bacterium]
MQDATVPARPVAKGGGMYYVPIVFHVLYHTAAQNLSDATILTHLDFINADFARTNADAVNTPSDLLGLAAATNIQFCLASVDPAGNPTGGITHTYTDTALWMDTFLGNNHFQTASGGLDAWDTHHYLNVYIIDRSYFGGTSSQPSSMGQPWDGIAVDCNEITNSHTPTHELGHYFGLKHVFGGTLAKHPVEMDLVADTPPANVPLFLPRLSVLLMRQYDPKRPVHELHGLHDDQLQEHVHHRAR